MSEKPTLNIVLVEPRIPQNTGNVARTCACTACRLHLVGPMGFAIDDKKLKHAGLDYWHYLDISYYDSLDDFFSKNDGPFYYFTTKAPQRYTDVAYPDGAYLSLIHIYVLGACQIVRECQSGRSGPSDPILPDHDSSGLDEHPYHSDLLSHFYHQYGVPVCQGDDQRRAQRCLGCGPELYVQPERCRSVRLQHGNRCGYLPVLVRLVRLCQSCHQP